MDNQEYLVYSLLGTKTRRILRRSKTRSGEDFQYEPRGDLLVRLSTQTGLSMAQCRQVLIDIWKKSIRNPI